MVMHRVFNLSTHSCTPALAVCLLNLLTLSHVYLDLPVSGVYRPFHFYMEVLVSTPTLPHGD